VVVSLLPGAPVVAALIAFRALYYLVPFALGCLALLAAELVRRRGRSRHGGRARPDGRFAGAAPRGK
jgi:hypothetical protein